VPGAIVGQVLRDQAPLLPPSATVVSAIAGANDLLEYRYRPIELGQQVLRLLELAALSGQVVLTSTCPDFFAHRFGPASKLSRRIEALNDIVRGAIDAASIPLVVLETHTVLQDHELWDDDGIHPNPLGHRLLAERAVELLRPHLPAAFAPLAGHHAAAAGG
jgi:lysophospholipase L1-like esterase